MEGKHEDSSDTATALPLSLTVALLFKVTVFGLLSRFVGIMKPCGFAKHIIFNILRKKNKFT
jgi:hypothetical protein